MSKLLKAIRRWRKRQFVRVLEKQLDEMFDRKASVSEVEAQRQRIFRARRQLADMVLVLALFTGAGCAHVSTQDALEAATVAVDAAQERCAGKLAHLKGDESQKAVKARRECLKLPDLGDEQDAVDALALELETARRWTLDGR